VIDGARVAPESRAPHPVAASTTLQAPGEVHMSDTGAGSATNEQMSAAIERMRAIVEGGRAPGYRCRTAGDLPVSSLHLCKNHGLCFCHGNRESRVAPRRGRGRSSIPRHGGIRGVAVGPPAGGSARASPPPCRGNQGTTRRERVAKPRCRGSEGGLGSDGQKSE
jgi:hypothetical protein